MTTHPVMLHVEPPAQADRVHVLIRLVLLLALGAIGCSSLCAFLYLALPAAAALLVARKDGDRYLAEDAPHIVRGLRWLAAACGYLWLLADALPSAQAGPVELHIETGGAPSAGSALLRLLYTLPALVVLVALSFAGGLLWLVAAVWVLVRRRVPLPIADFLALTLCYQFRLVAYHLSLVDRYPSLESAGIAHAAT